MAGSTAPAAQPRRPCGPLAEWRSRGCARAEVSPVTGVDAGAERQASDPSGERYGSRARAFRAAIDEEFLPPSNRRNPAHGRHELLSRWWSQGPGAGGGLGGSWVTPAGVAWRTCPPRRPCRVPDKHCGRQEEVRDVQAVECKPASHASRRASAHNPGCAGAESAWVVHAWALPQLPVEHGLLTRCWRRTTARCGEDQEPVVSGTCSRPAGGARSPWCRDVVLSGGLWSEPRSRADLLCSTVPAHQLRLEPGGPLRYFTAFANGGQKRHANFDPTRA